MRFADEIVNRQKELDIPSDVEPDKKELDIAKCLIETMATDFDPNRYKDEYKERAEPSPVSTSCGSRRRYSFSACQLQ
jgi:DNA end-binding protein Ku